MSRAARVSDIDAICRSLPEVELGTSWGDRPTYLVRQKPKPRGFVLARAPRHDAVDPETGEEYDDLLVIRTANAEDKAALVEADGPFFTIDHFRGYNARPGPAEPARGGRRRGAARGPDRRLAGGGAEVARHEVPGRRAVSTAPDPARRAAFEVLKAVRAKGAYTNLVLPHQLGKYRLDGRDAAFATELAAGTIRRQGTYDAILAVCTDRPLANTAAKVLDVLRLGCHQLLGMRVAPHAAISTSVDLVRAEVGPGPAGFVNAVLRKVSAHDLDTWLTRIDADRATRYSHPQWIVDALAEALAESPGKARTTTSSTPCSPPTTCHRPSRSWPGRVGPAPTSSTDGARPTRRTASSPRAVTRARCRPSPKGAPASRTRAPSSSPSPSRPPRSRVATPAGSTCAPAPAARLRCSLPWRPARRARRRQRAAAPPGRAGPTRARRRRRRGGGHRGRRHRASVEAGFLRPGPGRRTMHRAGRPAPAARGPLAAAAGGPRVAGPAAASPAGRRGGPGPPWRRRPLRHLLPGARRDPRRRGLAPGQARRREAGRCRAADDGRRRSTQPMCPTVPVRSGGRSSSGRTATAPMRCSWPSSAGLDRGPTRRRNTLLRIRHAGRVGRHHRVPPSLVQSAPR